MENQLQWFEKIENVYRHLQDEESRVLFNARFYFFENREEDFFDVVGSYYHDWKNVDGPSRARSGGQGREGGEAAGGL